MTKARKLRPAVAVTFLCALILTISSHPTPKQKTRQGRWGSEDLIRQRMIEHHEAGATHIAISPLNPEGKGPQPHWKLLEALAPAG